MAAQQQDRRHGMSALSCHGLTAGYGDVVVLRGIDLKIAAGETVALLGPSGSGKTTLLYAIAGLLPIASGALQIGGVEVDASTPPEDRSIGMVFQNYALWPHLAARDTVAYPLIRQGYERSQALAEAQQLLDLVGIGHLGERLPDQLSGGQQQRVGLARALARRPRLYLFDEPTAHLDAGLRDLLQAELGDAGMRDGAAAVYTTHDAAEAMAVADRIAVMREGRIVQIGSPAGLYEAPQDEWVARLTGPVSVLSTEVRGVADGAVELAVGGVGLTVGGGAASPQAGVVLVRPDWASLGGPLQGTVAGVRYEGPHTDYLIESDAGTVRVRQAGAPELWPGDDTGWSLHRVWVCAGGTLPQSHG
jgi:ABC-type Fe3+/spermidine/putrescine transport system ATPase subunit